jgi:hypothetical protein
MTKILGISGKKQSGKTSTGNFLFGCAMLSLEVVEYAEVDESGNLIVPYADADGNLKPCIFPVNSLHPDMISYMSENVWSKTKVYNFADNLKRICIDILGLTEQQCYGAEEEKNSLTDINLQDCIFDTMRCRKMTAREVMQYVGTDFFRRIYPQVWVESTIRKIQKESPELAIIVDCRFENEVKGIQEAGGKVIRFTRNIYGDSDQHPSETALDNYEGFDAVIDNQSMTLGEQNEAAYNKIAEWGYANFKAVAYTQK